jgi:hypothetical protein
MQSFESEEIYIDPSEYVSSCSKREIAELIDCLEEDGLVIRISDNSRGISTSVWSDMIEHLSGLQLQMTVEDEEIIKNIIKKYDATYTGY